MTTTTPRRPRSDAYADTPGRPNAPCGHLAPCGCQLARCCFACPSPRCKFDAGGLRTVRSQSLARTAKQLRALHFSAPKIAGTLAISRRTVFRLLRED